MKATKPISQKKQDEQNQQMNTAKRSNDGSVQQDRNQKNQEQSSKDHMNRSHERVPWR